MRSRFLSVIALLVAGLAAHSACATPIAFFGGQTITTSSNTQLGRISRNGQPQTWTGAESAFPGVVNPNTTYYYNTYTINNADFNPNNYVDISFTDTLGAGLLFISAYLNNYDPTNLQKNWIGDLGLNSAAYGPNNSLFFDPVVTPGSNLVLVVNTTGAGTNPSASGINNPFDIYVNGYTSTDYDDAPVTPYVAATPEPSTFIELGTGLLAMAGLARRRLFSA